MQNTLGILTFALYPALSVVAGGMLALWRPLKPGTVSAIQHFAAGLLFCALATELLPDLVHRKLPWITLIGFTLGVIAMLMVKHYAEQSGQKSISTPTIPTSLIAILAIDVALDGLLIGLGFAAGQKQGVLLTTALTLEVLFLGLSGAVTLSQGGSTRNKILWVTLGFAVILLVGAMTGSTLLVFASNTTVDAILAFGLAALLYLVTEELLVEAHEVPETSMQTAMFFFGFILLLTIDMLM